MSFTAVPWTWNVLLSILPLLVDRCYLLPLEGEEQPSMAIIGGGCKYRGRQNSLELYYYIPLLVMTEELRGYFLAFQSIRLPERCLLDYLKQILLAEGQFTSTIRPQCPRLNRLFSRSGTIFWSGIGDRKVKQASLGARALAKYPDFNLTKAFGSHVPRKLRRRRRR